MMRIAKAEARTERGRQCRTKQASGILSEMLASEVEFPGRLLTFQATMMAGRIGDLGLMPVAGQMLGHGTLSIRVRFGGWIERGFTEGEAEKASRAGSFHSGP